MAEMVGLSRNLRSRNGAIGGFVAAMRQHLARLVGRNRPTELRMDEWSDYLLRDMGLDSSIRDEMDPRAKATGWLRR